MDKIGRSSGEWRSLETGLDRRTCSQLLRPHTSAGMETATWVAGSDSLRVVVGTFMDPEHLFESTTESIALSAYCRSAQPQGHPQDASDSTGSLDSLSRMFPTASAPPKNAGQHPVFVADAYTRRILAHYSLLPEDDVAFSVVQAERTSAAESAPRSSAHPVQVYNDTHALVVGVGKSYCLKSQPRCHLCPWQTFLAPSRSIRLPSSGL